MRWFLINHETSVWKLVIIEDVYESLLNADSFFFYVRRYITSLVDSFFVTAIIFGL